ncbi:MAG: chromate transporter [Candidatus Izemoplasmatales bacterium]|jgi:chromate transporter
MLGDLFLLFFKIGLFTFGGGYAMIPLIQREVIEKRGWIEYSEFMDILAIAESTPGPIAINCATYIGFKQKGFIGSLLATLGVVLPSFIVIVLISAILLTYKESPLMANAFQGIRVGVSLLIVNAGIRLLTKLKRNWLACVLIVIGFGLMLFRLVPTMYIILIGGVAGLIYSLCGKKGDDRDAD